MEVARTENGGKMSKVTQAACWFTSSGSVCYLLLLTNPSIIIHTIKVSLKPLKYYLTIKSHDGAKAGSVRLRGARTCALKSYIW